ncbi:MAG: hypothetical protein GY822_28895, partial [Deltaproteobacteria bacterium]|nr:hypothetical protein [Deltaproteobacteria bacterium]
MFSLIKSDEQHEIDASSLEQSLETVSSHINFIWNAIINVWLDKARKEGVLLPDDFCLTQEELAHADDLTERMLVTPPQKFFKPENDAVGRTTWFMGLITTTAKLITATKKDDEAFRGLEKEIGRIKVVEEVFTRAAVQNGGVVRPLTPREITVLKELEVQTRIRAALNRQKSSGIEPSPEDAALILAHQSKEPVTGTVQEDDDKIAPEVIV